MNDHYGHDNVNKSVSVSEEANSVYKPSALRRRVSFDIAGTELSGSHASLHKLVRKDTLKIRTSQKMSEGDFQELMSSVDQGHESNTVLERATYHSGGALLSYFPPEYGVQAKSAILLCAGGIAGGVAKTTVAPLERIKLLNQAGQSKGIYVTLQSVVTREGVKGLWTGNWANVVRMIPNKGILLMGSDMYKDLLSSYFKLDDLGHKPAWFAAAAGALSGATAIIATYPLDLARTRMAGLLMKKGEKSRFSTIFGTIRLTWKEEGFLALYRGIWPTLIGSFPYEGIKFGSYDVLKHYMPRDWEGRQGVFWKVICGSIAATIAHVITYPNDTIRRRMQLQGIKGEADIYRNAFHCFSKITKAEGVPALYRGLTVTLLRGIPNTGIQFGVYEALKDFLDVHT